MTNDEKQTKLGPLSPSLAALLGVKSLRDVPELRALAEARHRALVIEDDYLCDTFGFSRKAKGKHAER